MPCGAPRTQMRHIDKFKLTHTHTHTHTHSGACGASRRKICTQNQIRVLHSNFWRLRRRSRRKLAFGKESPYKFLRGFFWYYTRISKRKRSSRNLGVLNGSSRHLLIFSSLRPALSMPLGGIVLKNLKSFIFQNLNKP